MGGTSVGGSRVGGSRVGAVGSVPWVEGFEDRLLGFGVRGLGFRYRVDGSRVYRL